MSESERRRSYRYNRVLIESARVLDPQFDDAVVYLTGAQIEMLRNVIQYLNRLDTYVTEYNPGYYIAPTVEDYDTILAIVANLEEVLMGNPNTIWGYADRWQNAITGTSTGEAYTLAETPPVPEGYVYVLEHWTINQWDTGTRHVTLRVTGGTGSPVLFDAPALPTNQDIYEAANITLKEGDTVRLIVFALADTKTCHLTVRGHTMVVP
ncbi:MAG: hypothetical protein V3W44_10420 [Dehalococcoidales bacterium]